jgi:penicillin-binding protein 2
LIRPTNFELAEENRINMGLIPPARGLIYDINGVVLAGQRIMITMTREGARRC